jgi:hypothetical protein
VNSQRQVKLGTLVSDLTLSGDIAAYNGNHVVYFVGEQPCHKDGTEILSIKHSDLSQQLVEGVTVNRQFSNKPPNGYRNYYDKMTRYVAIISNEAIALDPGVTPTPFLPVETTESESPFAYLDSASSRSDIVLETAKFQGLRIAIVGVGGTGSYVLDLIAKTPVKEIHLFDGDQLLQHNAFRSPGAASIKQLGARPLKVDYFAEQYSKIHRGIVRHPYRIDMSNVDQLRGMNFVFICVDRGESRKLLVEKLEELGINFIDVGMGLVKVDSRLSGILRVTTSTAEKRNHLRDGQRAPFHDIEDEEYVHNIQIADLNCLNAALAVVKWKKLCGFYLDLEQEHHSTYTISGDMVTNDDQK